MKPLIIANCKMNFSLKEADEYCINLTDKKFKNQLIISFPVPYMAYLADKFKTLAFCAQNISIFDSFGAYTGEYSSLMVKSCGINYSIIGHSERRNLFDESEEMVLQKVINCLKLSITPIICIGESLKIRQNGTYKEFINKQLYPIIDVMSSTRNKEKIDVIIAYEPIWSIGTGLTPSVSELVETFALISSLLKQSAVAFNIRLVYGGSIDLDNIKQIMALENIDGVLVGKASLNCDTVIKMLELVEEHV